MRIFFFSTAACRRQTGHFRPGKQKTLEAAGTTPAASSTAGVGIPAGCYAGKRIEKRLPLPIPLSTEIVPPCASTNSLEMASPNPLPWTFVPGTRK